MGNMLFTGFPGFLASNLIKELRQQDAVSKIYVLVLPSQLPKAKEVIEEIGQDGKDIPIIPIEGDITLPNAGLLEETMEQLVQEVEYIWHLAAIYDLAVPKDLAWKVNVHGTDIMNHFALKFQISKGICILALPTWQVLVKESFWRLNWCNLQA